jgi:hypothetical protein
MTKLFQLQLRHGSSAMLRATLCALLIVVAAPLGAQEQKRWQAPGLVQTEVALALVLAVDAFMVPAMSYDTFADAILKKLITEIADLHRKR